MFKRNQVVGIAGIHSQYQARVVRRDSMAGWWVVREIPEDAERAAFFKHLPRQLHGACVHDSQLQAAFPLDYGMVTDE